MFNFYQKITHINRTRYFIYIFIVILLLTTGCFNLYKPIKGQKKHYGNHYSKKTKNKSKKKKYDPVYKIEKSFLRYYDKSKGGKAHFKIGKPYKIFGKKYVPRIYKTYSRVGIASWYGSEEHGTKTSNGEIFNKHDMTAAHTTLPIPSIVKVTNLKNNRSIFVRVNDRGPYAKNRLIDLSENAATQLGFRQYGITKVRVTYMKNHTRRLHKKLFGKSMID